MAIAASFNSIYTSLTRSSLGRRDLARRAGFVVLPSIVRFTTAVGVWGDDDELSECQINLGGCLHVGLKATLLVLIDS
jgi:hypothetical protein